MTTEVMSSALKSRRHFWISHCKRETTSSRHDLSIDLPVYALVIVGACALCAGKKRLTLALLLL